MSDSSSKARTSAEEVAYRARALAQAHPLTPLAKEFMDLAIAEEKTNQPIPELGTWAGAAFLNAYCVRLVEESSAGLELAPDEKHKPQIAALDEAATRIAGELRTEEIERHVLGEADDTVEALDRIVASEVSRRLDNLKDEVDQAASGELEEYLTWWVVKGYALRIAEADIGALRPMTAPTP